MNKRATREIRCLTFDAGERWLHWLDRLPPPVRERLTRSNYNICPACLVVEARNNGVWEPTAEFYLRLIAAIEFTLGRCERCFNAGAERDLATPLH